MPGQQPRGPVLQKLDSREEPVVALRALVKAKCPGRTMRPVLPPRDGVSLEIECHWKLRKMLRQLGGVYLLRSVFRAIALHAKAQRAHRALKKACRQKKRDRLLQGLQQIEQASERKDGKAFYAFVKLVSPKPFVPKIKLRDARGMTLTKTQEGEQLREYAEELFHAGDVQLPPLEPSPPELFSRQSSEWAIMQLKKGKAVPSGSAQIASWQASSRELSATLEAICRDTVRSGKPYIPTLWTRVQLAWLPKPGKSPSCPEHLRSIGLMGVDTKAFMVILKSEAHQYIMRALQHTPQFAYRSGVCTTDAILRVGDHCNLVRRDIESTSTSHLSKLLGDQVPELIGGLALSLDLSKALDSLTFSEMSEALVAAGMPEYLVRLILHVHKQSVCEIVHGSFNSSVPMRRGLRQGCPAAPVIYSAWTALLCRRLVAAFGEGWDARTMTIFADDKRLCWQIRSMKSLEKALSQISTVLAVLSSACMKVNVGKSEVLMLLRGKRADEARRRFVSVRGGEGHLRVPHSGSSAYFTIKSKIRYLGVVLSYGGFEAQTAAYRCDQAKSAFGQLRSVLRTGSCLTKADRLRVYRACVWSVLEYGLIGVGLDRKALDSVKSAAAGQLRKVLRIHGRGITNQQVFEQAALNPEEILLGRMDRKLDMMPEQSVEILQAVRARLVRVRDNLSSIIEASGSFVTPCVVDSSIACPVCGIYFANEVSLNMHIKSGHPQIHDASRVQFVKARHALGGIPQCFFCLKMLCDHHSLEKHVTMGGCSVIKEAISKGQTLEDLEAEISRQHKASPPEVPEQIREINQEGPAEG